MSSVAASNASRDVKVYPVYPPWYGKAGAEFERTFEPDFLANVGSHIKDKYSNAAKHLTGKDPGGVTPPTAAALALNAGRESPWPRISQFFFKIWGWCVCEEIFAKSGAPELAIRYRNLLRKFLISLRARLSDEVSGKVKRNDCTVGPVQEIVNVATP